MGPVVVAKDLNFCCFDYSSALFFDLLSYFKHIAFTLRVKNIMKLRFYLIRILLSDWKSRRFEDKAGMES